MIDNRNFQNSVSSTSSMNLDEAYLQSLDNRKSNILNENAWMADDATSYLSFNVESDDDRFSDISESADIVHPGLQIVTPTRITPY